VDDYVEERRASERYEITVKDVYDVAHKTEAIASQVAVDVLQIKEDGRDHETRLRALEEGRWKLTAALVVATFALAGASADIVTKAVQGG
jgi:hypothetical protein